MKLLETAEGQLITAAAMIDDVFSLILLSMLTVVQDAALAESSKAASSKRRSRAPAPRGPSSGRSSRAPL